MIQKKKEREREQKRTKNKIYGTRKRSSSKKRSKGKKNKNKNRTNQETEKNWYSFVEKEKKIEQKQCEKSLSLLEMVVKIQMAGCRVTATTTKIHMAGYALFVAIPVLRVHRQRGVLQLRTSRTPVVHLRLIVPGG
jgi:hypothetical protein